MEIKKIAIIGAGTAGWLSANHLGKALQHHDVAITLIESPDIPTIGVGEGTVPMMRETLKHFGISESDFIQHCDVTFKQSIKFVNWLDSTRFGKHNAYHHLFDFPFPNNHDLTPFWLRQDTLNSHKSYADTVSFQGLVCDSMRAPKTITTPEYVGETTYAYHLNAKKFASLLEHHAKQQFNVQHVKANVTGVLKSDSGWIHALETDTEGVVDFDFYLDCTGFSCFLLGQNLHVPFVDLSHKLPIDKAITAQIPTDPESEIPPYTIATAHQAGWIWDIALTNRRGTGFVYSSKHLSDAQARTKFERYLGQSLDGVTSKTIDMKIGYRQVFWQQNCVAIGLSQGFVEPLEATAILITDFCARHLAERFPTTKEQVAHNAKRFNHNVKYAWDRVVDFIQLHYFLSDRTDSEFWRQWQDDTRLSDTLKEKLLLWQTQSPISTDFFSKFEVFDVENFLYVLYGMHFKTTLPASVDKTQMQRDEILAEQVSQHAKHLADALPSHRALLNKINQFGLNKV